MLEKRPNRAPSLLLALVSLSCGNPRPLIKAPEEVGATQSALPLPTPGYATSKAFALTKRRDGIDGRLELLIDSRIRNNDVPVREGLPSCNPCAPLDGSPAAAFCSSLMGEPLRHARVRLVSRAGEPIVSRELECPLAEATTTPLHPDLGLGYLVTVDLSTEAGAYTGPVTRIADVVQGSLHWVAATDSTTGETRELQLTSSLKEAWRLAPRTGGGVDILVAAGGSKVDAHAPAGAEPTFTLELDRYSFEGKVWRRFSRTEAGFWESDGEFPERARFP